MAWRKCEFCGYEFWGDIKLSNHQRQAHPYDYWVKKAEAAEKRAERELNDAKRYWEYAHVAENTLEGVKKDG